MSFSRDVKKEISSVFDTGRHCCIAELAALLNSCGRITHTESGPTILLKTENPYTADKFTALVQQSFGKADDCIPKNEARTAKQAMYTVSVVDSTVARALLWATGILDKSTGKVTKRIDPLIINRSCCKRACIRGAFLGSGSISRPDKAYHLEFLTAEEPYAKQLSMVLQSFDVEPKSVVRKGYHIVYFKKSEEISDVLKIIGANTSTMAFENQRVAKDVENTINRVANCMAVNADKTVVAAVRQMEDIELIRQRSGLDSLPPSLAEIAEIRINNPIISLKEIGELLNPPVGKSGVNHRLRKISQIADGLR